MIPADLCRSVPVTTGPRLVLCPGVLGVANLSTPECTPGSLRSGTGLIRSPRNIKSQVGYIFIIQYFAMLLGAKNENVLKDRKKKIKASYICVVEIN